MLVGLIQSLECPVNFIEWVFTFTVSERRQKTQFGSIILTLYSVDKNLNINTSVMMIKLY